MKRKLNDPFGARAGLPQTGVDYYRLDRLGRLDHLPFTIKILLEALLRHCDGVQVTAGDVEALAGWQAGAPAPLEIPFKPGRVLLQDFTGVPALVDLAAMRAAVARMGGDPGRINPVVPVDLVVDHSVQVDAFGSADARLINIQREFARNRERYEFLKWGQKAFHNLGIIPPATGIVHQVNLEYLSRLVWTRPDEAGVVAFPDSLVGADSHTTMVGGLGVLGWGVGGIEAEAAMLGQPVYLLTPEVIGVRLSGRLPEGSTATDLVLAVTERLRRRKVVGKFVEFFGPGLDSLTLADRATVANMCPEYGATVGFFPVDGETLAYLRQTGRPDELVDLVERYTRAQGLFRLSGMPEPEFSDVVELELGEVQPGLAGPKRPQDRIGLGEMKRKFREALLAPAGPQGLGVAARELGKRAALGEGYDGEIGHGAVVLVAITSCTNTSNPGVMLAAGLLAKKAVEAGLRTPAHVKTSLAPGSRVVEAYLKEAGLLPYLEALGFHIVGFGCTTCIGNAGPLPEPVRRAILEQELVVASVLSGNRNFEGRVHPLTRANYLASPPLVVAFALAGRVDIDLRSQPIGRGRDGRDVYLEDIWPDSREVADVMGSVLAADMFRAHYDRVQEGSDAWKEIPVRGGELYEWDPASTYIQEPPFFTDLGLEVGPITNITGARVLVKVGDSVTTDHISPAGSISPVMPAGHYLLGRGIEPAGFNSYGSRRGNDQVMVRGTFTNVRFRNQLAPGVEGGWTTFLPAGEVTTIYDASLRYRESGTPLVVIAGKEYGMGSSRDWAAKGVALLGVKMVIAESHERTHRSNLVGMGILPLEFRPGESADSLGLDGTELYSTVNLDDALKPRQELLVRAVKAGGREILFSTTCRIDTPVEVEYYRGGGILPTVLRRFARSGEERELPAGAEGAGGSER